MVQEFRLEKRQFQDVLCEVLVLGLEADDFAERLEEFVGGVDDELKVEVLDDVCLHLKDLVSSELVGTAGHQLFDLRHLICLFELGSNVKGSNADQLQLRERHFLGSQVLVNQRNNREERFREHLVFVVQLAEPIDEFCPGQFGDCFVRGEIVGEPMGQLLPAAQELHILKEVLRNHLRILTFQSVLGNFWFLLRSDSNPIGATALLVMERGVSGSLSVEEGVVTLVAVEFRLEVGYFFAEDAYVHVSVR